MLSKRRFLRVVSRVLAVAICTAGYSQDAGPSRVLFDRMPSDVGPVVAALGRRVQAAGKEQTVYAGQFLNPAGNPADVRVSHQLPGLVKLQGFLPGDAVASFDGSRASGAVGRMAEILLETFVHDLAEGMLSSVQQGAASRLLGRGFKPSARVAPNYTGPSYDIYEVAAPVRSRQGQIERLKRYYFDTRTGLLLSTRYTDNQISPAVNVDTRFTNWVRVDDSSYPGRIDRYEDGQLVFSFIVSAVTAGRRIDPSSFR